MNEQKINTTNKIIITVAVVLALAVILFAFVNTKKGTPTGTAGFYDKFAQCLTDKGAVMYGAIWCSHCQAQKAAFGTSFSLIKYVECPENTQLCIDNGIQSYPTWLMGTSTKLEGFDPGSSMKKLSDVSGCPLPENILQ